MNTKSTRPTALTALVTTLLAPATPAPAEPVSLEALRWSNRVLVRFAPHAGDPRALRLEAALEEAACAVADRDLVRLRVPSLPSADEISDVTASEARALRERFDVAPDTFRVVLVGKDGGEKLRLDEVPELDDVFALIDGMPMRRAEMRANGDRCPS